MADITGLPTGVRPLEADWGFRANIASFPAPLIGTTTPTLGIPGSKWTQSLRFNNMTDANSGELEAIFVQLEGGVNRLVLHRVGRSQPRGKAQSTPGTPVVNGASQTGSSIAISGAPNNITDYLVPGDMFSIGGELKLCTGHVNTNGSGQATIPFKFALRASPTNGSAVVLIRPTTRWLMADPNMKWTHVRAKIVSGHGVEFVESFS